MLGLNVTRGRRAWLCSLVLACLLPGLALAVIFSGPEWQNIYQTVEAQYGVRARLRVDAWRELMSERPAVEEERALLEEVNLFFNQLNFVDDHVLWAEKDYWATPLEFLGANGGDCEDFSIAKYLTLLALGIDQDKLRVTYVKALTLNQFHMVVAYYAHPSAVPLILDNIDGEIKPATARGDLVPIYSFNGQNLWLNKEKGRGILAGKATRLERWNDLRLRHRVQSLRKPALVLE